MRKLLPYAGIAVAVAAGVALAPYFWWLVPMACVVVICWWQRRYWPFVVVTVLYGWPIWLASRRQYPDAVFAAVCVTLLLFWRPLMAKVRLMVSPD